MNKVYCGVVFLVVAKIRYWWFFVKSGREGNIYITNGVQ